MFQLPGVRNYTEAIDEAAARKARHDRIQVGDNDTASQVYGYIGRDFLSPNESFCESWRSRGVLHIIFLPIENHPATGDRRCLSSVLQVGLC